MKTIINIMVYLVLYLLTEKPAVAQALAPEEEGIRIALTHYTEGRNNGDLERLRKAFHPAATLKFVHPETKEFTTWTLAEYMTKLSPGKKQDCTAEILDIRQFADAAQATVVLRYPQVTFYDYMSLLKVNGQWLISDKIFARKAAWPKVLIAVTSHADLGSTGRKAGLYLAEVSHVYKALVEAGYEVDFVSPKGEVTHMYGNDTNDPVNLWFLQQSEAYNRLKQAKKPEEVNPADYSAIYYAGGHGAMWDFPDNEQLAKLAASIYETKGVVGAICHGVIGLANVRLSNGKYLVEGKRLTGFTNAEEKEIKLEKVVPVLLQTVLEQRGAEFVAEKNWSVNVQADGRLITGQNAQSVDQMAQEFVRVLKEQPSATAER